MGKWLVIPINPVYVMFSVSCFEEVKHQPFCYKVMDIQLFSYPFKLRLCPGFLIMLAKWWFQRCSGFLYPDP